MNKERKIPKLHKKGIKRFILNVLHIFKSDIVRISTSWVTLVILLGLIVLPPIYAWLNIYTSWDPYGNTKGLKVAVVSEDVGSSAMDVSFNIGSELISNLKENDKIGWEFCDNDYEAIKMVENDEAYAAIIIPEDFSLSLTTVLQDNPKKLTIDFYVNQKMNAIAPKIVGSVINTIKTQVSTNIIQTVVQKMLENMNDTTSQLKDDYPELQDSVTLLDKIQEETTQLPENLNSLSTNVQDGMVVIDTASDEYANIIKMSDDFVKFNSGMSDLLKDANVDIEQYTPELRADLDSIQRIFADVSEDANYLSDEITTNKPKIIEELDGLSDSLDELKSDTNDICKDLKKFNNNDITDIIDLNSSISKDIDRIQEIIKEVQSNSSDITEVEKLLVEIGYLCDDIADNLDTMDDKSAGIYESTDNVLKSLAETSQTLTDLVSELNDSGFSSKLLSTIDSTIKNLTSINETLKKSKTNFQDIIETNNKIIDELEKIKAGDINKATISELNNSVKDFEESVSKLADKTRDKQAKEALDNLGDVLKQVENILTKLEDGKIDENMNQIITSSEESLKSANELLMNTSDMCDNVVATNEKMIELLKSLSKGLNNKDLEKLEDNLAKMTKEINTLQTNFEKSKGSVDQDMKDSKIVFRQIDKVCSLVAGDMSDLSKSIDKYMVSLSDSLSKMQAGLGEVNEKLTGIQKEGTGKFDEKRTDLNSEIDSISKNVKKLEDSVGDSSKMETLLDDIGSASMQASTSIDTLLNFIDDEKMLKLEQNIANGSVALLSLNDVLSSSDDIINDFNNFSKDVEKTGQTTLSRIEDLKADAPKIQDVATTLTKKISKVNGNVTYEDLEKFVQRDAKADSAYFSSPVDLCSHDVFVSKNYGQGLSPFYSVLALWVGGMFLSAMLKAKVSSKDSNQYTPREEYFGKLFLFTTVAMLQGIVTALGDLYILKIPVASSKLFIVLCAFFSITFALIVYSLVATLDNVGKALGIVLLLLQVTASGGTFPIQVTPPFFRSIYKFMPFTYAINGLREAIFGVNYTNLHKDVITLAIYGLGFTTYGLLLKKPLNKLFGIFAENMKKSGIIH